MKIYQLKQEVYELTSTKTTTQLKLKRPKLTKDKDLRRKDSWIAIYNTFKLIDDFQQDRITKEVLARHEFKSLDRNSTFDDLLNNVRSLGSLHNSLESKLNILEQKINVTRNTKNEF